MVIRLVILVIFGWLLSGGLNYLADVLPATRKLSAPVCPQCGQRYSAWRYLVNQKCSNCGQQSSRRDWAVLIGTICAIPLVYFFPPDRFGFWISLPYLLYFALIIIIDVEHRVVLNEMILIGTVLAIPLGLEWNEAMPTIIGGLSGFGIMLALYYFGVLFNRVLSKIRGEEITEVALGYGDVSLSLVIGFLVGWPKIGISLLFAVLLGGFASAAVLGVSLVRKKYRAFTAIPYAPFLSAAAVVMIYMA